MVTDDADHRRDLTGWFTSTCSNNGNQCVEVRFEGSEVFIRDSKYRRDPAHRRGDEPVITVTRSQWSAFLDTVKHPGCSGVDTSCGVVADLSARPGRHGNTTLCHGSTELVFTAAEWAAFLAGARNGEFDPLELPAWRRWPVSTELVPAYWWA